MSVSPNRYGWSLEGHQPFEFATNYKMQTSKQRLEKVSEDDLDNERHLELIGNISSKLAKDHLIRGQNWAQYKDKCKIGITATWSYSKSTDFPAVFFYLCHGTHENK